MALCALGATTGALGQPGHIRAGQWDFYLLAQYFSASDINVKDVTLIPPGNLPSVTSDLRYGLQDEITWGFGFGYNVSERLTVRSEFTFGHPDYEMTYNNTRITGTAYTHTGKVNLDFNLLKDRPFTPFISAGLGYNYMDTGVPSGPPEFYYWWDYWWNVPVVSVNVPTFTETSFTYNVTGGVRWDVSPSAVIRLTVTQNWIDQDHRGGTLETLETNLSFGWKW